MLFRSLVLVRGDELRQLVAILDAPQHGDEIGVLVIEYLAGKALHLALHGAGPAKQADKASPPVRRLAGQFERICGISLPGISLGSPPPRQADNVSD